MRRYEDLVELLEVAVWTIGKTKRELQAKNWSSYRYYLSERNKQQEQLKTMLEDPEWVAAFMQHKLRGLDWKDAIR